MRMTPSFSIFGSPRVSRIVWKAGSHGRLRSEIDILPLTSSPITMFLVLSAARRRGRLTTSASLKSKEMSREPFDGRSGAAGPAGAGGAWVMRVGPGLGTAASVLAGAAAGAGGAPALMALAPRGPGAGGKAIARPASAFAV